MTGKTRWGKPGTVRDLLDKEREDIIRAVLDQDSTCNRDILIGRMKAATIASFDPNGHPDVVKSQNGALFGISIIDLISNQNRLVYALIYGERSDDHVALRLCRANFGTNRNLIIENSDWRCARSRWRSKEY